jgi:hypothetical protein
MIMFDDFGLFFTGGQIEPVPFTVDSIVFRQEEILQGQEDLAEFLALTELDINVIISNVRSEVLDQINQDPDSAESRIAYATLTLFTQDRINHFVEVVANAQSLIEFYRDELPFDLTPDNVAALQIDAYNAGISGLGISFDLFDVNDFPPLTVETDFTAVDFLSDITLPDLSQTPVLNYDFSGFLTTADGFEFGNSPIQHYDWQYERSYGG